MDRSPRKDRSSRLPITLLAAALAAALGTSAAVAQTWSGGTPYGGDVRTLAQSAVNPNRLFAGTPGGLFRSDDGGVHWTRKLAGTGLAGSGRTTGVAVADALPGRVYAADGAGWIYRSDDDGESFAAVYQLTPLPNDVTGLFVVPDSGDRLFATTSKSGFWYSDDAGQHFALADAGMPPNTTISDVAISATTPPMMVAFNSMASDAPLYSSFIGANGWSESSGFVGDPAAATWIASTAYLGTLDTGGSNVGHLYSGVATSWREVMNPCYRIEHILADVGNTQPEWLSCGIEGLQRVTPGGSYTSPTDSNGQRIEIRQTLRDRTDFEHLWAVSKNFGVFESRDEGRSWSPVNNGLSATNFRSVAIDPRHPQRIFAGYINEYASYSNPGLLVSNNAGGTWIQSDLNSLEDQLRAIAVDPTIASEASSTVLYASGGGLNSGIYKSIDGGLHWSALFAQEDDLIYSFFRDLVLDKRSCATPPASGSCTQGPLQSFYAVGPTDRGLRVIRGNADGTGLTRLGDGLPATINTPETYERIDVISIALDPNDSNRLYLGTFLRWSPKVTPALPPQLDNGVFRSDDAGVTWLPVNEGLPHQTGSAKSALDIFALATHPSRSGTLWAAGSFKNGDEGSRVFRSDDAGAHWQEQVVSAECDLRRLLVDPTAPDIVYASGRLLSQGSGCVLRSEDGGSHWTRVDAALPATSVMAMAQVPNQHGHLVVGTNSGIWHLHDTTDRMFDSGFD